MINIFSSLDRVSRVLVFIAIIVGFFGLFLRHDLSSVLVRMEEVVEGLRSIDGSAVIVDVDSNAGHHSEHADVKHAKEDRSHVVGDDADKKERTHNRIHLILVGQERQQNLDEGHVANNDGNLSKEDEYGGNPLRHGETNHVLEVEQECLPSTMTEVVTSNSNIAESRLVEVVGDVLKALQAADCATSDHSNATVAVSFSPVFQFLRKVHNGVLNEADDRDD